MKVVRWLIFLIYVTSCNSEVEVSLVDSDLSGVKQLSLGDSKFTLELEEGQNYEISGAKFEYEGSSYSLSVVKKGRNVFEFSPLVSVDVKLSKKFIFKYKSRGKWYLIEKNPKLPDSIPITALKGESGALGHGFSDSSIASWKNLFIKEDLSINIPVNYPSLIEAMDFLRSKRIASNALVTIQIADGEYNYLEEIKLDHLDNRRIQIIGNRTSPENVLLNFAGSVAFSNLKSNVFLKISGVTILGEGAVSSTGVQIGRKSYIDISDSIIEDFHRGLYFSSLGGAKGSGLSVENNYIGLSVVEGSAVDLGSSSYSNNDDDGIFIGVGGVASLDGSMINNNGSAGFEVWVNSYGANFGGNISGNLQNTIISKNSNIE